MTPEHPMLTGIRESMQANGSHTCHWGRLRREVYPDQPAWIALRTWCADNGYECELSFAEASKETEVHFRKAQPATAPAEAPAPSDAAGAAPNPA